MRYPGFLKENGTIGFIAPSFGCATMPYSACFDRTIEVFKGMGYEVVEGPNTRAALGVGKSNTPKACGDEVNDFFMNKRSDVIIACGGGETMCEDLPYIDFEGIAKTEPTWYMGYSDNTNLTFLLPTLCDIAAIYGPCASEFSMEPWHPALHDAFDLLTGSKLSFTNYDGWEKEGVRDEENPFVPYAITEKYSQKIRGNAAKASKFEGRLIGGCMDCLEIMIGTPFDRVKAFNEKYKEDGIIWFLESCELNVMSVRRTLWHMEQAGWFEHVKGFLIGRPMMYDDKFIDLDMEGAFAGVLEKYDVPVILDMDLGHLSPMMPIVSGGYGIVEASDGNLRITTQLK